MQWSQGPLNVARLGLHSLSLQQGMLAIEAKSPDVTHTHTHTQLLACSSSDYKLLHPKHVDRPQLVKSTGSELEVCSTQSQAQLKDKVVESW